MSTKTKWTASWLLELIANRPRQRGFICLSSDFPPEWSNEACAAQPVWTAKTPESEKEGEL